mgnify:FL=1
MPDHNVPNQRQIDDFICLVYGKYALKTGRTLDDVILLVKLYFYECKTLKKQFLGNADDSRKLYKMLREFNPEIAHYHFQCYRAIELQS